MERKLASIQEIKNINPIPNADAIELAHVLGWKVVVKKGEFSVGDKIVYCEIDSLLPEKEEFEFLRKTSYRKPIISGDAIIQRGGFKIKTVKFRGQVSQGLCLPLNILPESIKAEIGLDVSEALDIIKYEPPIPACLSGVIKGSFPAFIPKTDETRVQVLEKSLLKHKGLTFYITEKLDGSSCTAFYCSEEDYGVCSRNLMFRDDDKSTFSQVVNELGIIKKLKEIAKEYGYEGLAIQGELIGPGIQKNKYGLKVPQLRIFNVLDISPNRDAKYMSYDNICKISDKIGVEMVPKLGIMELNHTVDDLVELSKGKSVLNSKVNREGIVLRLTDENYEYGSGRISFKAINPDFLLKYHDE